MKTKSTQISKKQKALLADIFKCDADELDILQKHNIKPSTYRKWLNSPQFNEEMNFMFDSALRQSRILIAKYMPLAAAKLVKLTEGDKEETVRKACLDIISLPMNSTQSRESQPPDDHNDLPENLTPEIAGKLLSFLANQNQTS